MVLGAGLELGEGWLRSTVGAVAVLAGLGVAACDDGPDAAPKGDASATKDEEPAAASPEDPAEAPPAADGESPPADAAPTPDTAPSGDAKTYTLGTHGLRLESRADGCTVHASTAGGAPVALPLTMEPPCTWLRWPYPPPTDPAESGGKARGTKDEPLAWEYSDGPEPVTVVVVIGGGLSETDAERRRKLEELGCGDETQGILLTASGALVSTRVAKGSVSCESSGTDEKELWLFAHEG